MLDIIILAKVAATIKTAAAYLAAETCKGVIAGMTRQPRERWVGHEGYIRWQTGEDAFAEEDRWEAANAMRCPIVALYYVKLEDAAELKAQEEAYQYELEYQREDYLPF